MDKVEQINREIKDLKHKRAVVRYNDAKRFREKNKKQMNVMDALIVVMILSNIGALLITNYMVVKKNPTMEFREANPVQAKISGYQGLDNIWQSLKIMFRSLFAYGILVGTYIWTRQKISCHNDYLFYFAMYAAVAMILFLDFINDFGYLLGKVI